VGVEPTPESADQRHCDQGAAGPADLRALPLADAYPRVSLDNGEISVSVFLPDTIRGYYRGTRFDWSGIIERVDYAGHRFYAPLHAEHNPQTHDCISGPAEEFGMTAPCGFQEAAPGQAFLKIGVGLLLKDDDRAYHFDRAYRMLRAGKWDVDGTRTQVSFLQEMGGENGWAYRYHKRIRLLPGIPALAITHALENTGTKTIDTDHYNHNFTIIDDCPYGPDYRIEFPFTTPTPIPLKHLGWFRGNTIDVQQALQGESIWLPVHGGGGQAENAALIRNERTGAAVRFQGDAPLTRMVFWAVERAACPEPFVSIRLAPGQAMHWQYRYLFSAPPG
jgi:hypothetical protein